MCRVTLRMQPNATTGAICSAEFANAANATAATHASVRAMKWARRSIRVANPTTPPNKSAPTVATAFVENANVRYARTRLRFTLNKNNNNQTYNDQQLNTLGIFFVSFSSWSPVSFASVITFRATVIRGRANCVLVTVTVIAASVYANMAGRVKHVIVLRTTSARP